MAKMGRGDGIVLLLYGCLAGLAGLCCGVWGDGFDWFWWGMVDYGGGLIGLTYI